MCFTKCTTLALLVLAVPARALDLLALPPCPTVNSSTQTCIEANNCSGVPVWRSTACSLVISVPPPESDVSKHLLEQPTLTEVWVMGGVSVGVVSLAGAGGALLWPALSSPFHRPLLSALLGLALGSLTSTALFQLIPEGFELRELEEGDSSQYLHTALFAWASIWAALLIEQTCKTLFHKKQNKIETGTECWTELKGGIVGQVQDHQHNHALLPQKTPKKGHVAPVAWMVILGDGLHNLIDGMSIGAGYSRSISAGLGISIAIAAEEFPHELGDFAVLVRSGMSPWRALAWNLVSALTAFIGLLIGVPLGHSFDAARFVFCLAAGLFLYISLTHLVPELKEMLSEEVSEGGRLAGLRCLVLQQCGMLTGTALVFLVTKYNHVIESLAT